MTHRQRNLFSQLVTISLAFCLLAGHAFAQGATAFTYQGRLNDAGQPANGVYDLQFALYDANTAGNQIGANVVVEDVAVTNGVFTVQLDFGAAAFNGAARHLAIGVRPGAGTGAFTPLTPRSPFTPTPYAIRSQNAASADNATQLNGVAASQYVQTNDARLNDARAPTAGSNNYLQNQNATVQGASFRISGSGIMSGPLTALNIITNDISAPGTITANRINASGEIAANGGLRVSGNFVAAGGLALVGGLSVGGNVVLNNAELRLRDSGDPHHSIRYDAGIDGIQFNAFREFQWVRTSNNTELMHLFGNGVLRAAGFNGRCVSGIFAGNGVCNQDLAETFRTKEQTEPGDVVSIIPEDNELPTVRRSLRGYDEHLVGVVSTSPGLVFDEGETKLAGENDKYITKEKTPVAAVGRVPVKFTLENGAINVGDPLTSSATEPGKAMKATGAGKIIGIALESSDKAQDGKLLMWLQVGYNAPAPSGTAELEQLKTANAALKAQQDKQQQQLEELQAQLAALAKQLPQPKTAIPQ